MNAANEQARDAAVQIIKQLQGAGHTALLAGGCVRDALLGQTPSDYDVATDALPKQVRKLFPQSKYVGEAFGVVLVYQNHQAIEVATFRKEWQYTDKRRPDHVAFCTAQEDAARRDFTVNALFADPLEQDVKAGGDKILDYVGGLADLKAGILRAVGDPDERFAEDYLRMLRAVRFAARLNFTLDQKTALAISPLAKYLGQISRERIGQELQFMLNHTCRSQAIVLMQQLKLDGPVLNEQPQTIDIPTMEQLHSNASMGTQLAAWMIDRHVQPQYGESKLQAVARFTQTDAHRIISRWRTALCLSNTTRDQLKHTLRLCALAGDWSSMDDAKQKRWLAHEHAQQARWLVAAVDAQASQSLEHQAASLLEQGVAPEPLVTGKDLIEMGHRPGRKFSRWLDAVYDAQLNGQVHTRDQAIHWLMQHIDGV